MDIEGDLETRNKKALFVFYLFLYSSFFFPLEVQGVYDSNYFAYIDFDLAFFNFTLHSMLLPMF